MKEKGCHRPAQIQGAGQAHTLAGGAVHTLAEERTYCLGFEVYGD